MWGNGSQKAGMPKLDPVVDAGQATTDFDFNKSSDAEKLQWAISELEKRVKVDSVCDIRKPVSSGLQRRLVRLIGAKPLFKCLLDRV